MRAKWRPIGSELDVTPGTLDAIEQEYSSPEDRLYRVLLYWLNRGLATWSQLVQALLSEHVDETIWHDNWRKTIVRQVCFNFSYFYGILVHVLAIMSTD